MIKHGQIVMTMLGALGYSILRITTPGAARTDKAADAVAG
jgi:hypothetical protein